MSECLTLTPCLATVVVDPACPLWRGPCAPDAPDPWPLVWFALLVTSWVVLGWRAWMKRNA